MRCCESSLLVSIERRIEPIWRCSVLALLYIARAGASAGTGTSDGASDGLLWMVANGGWAAGSKKAKKIVLQSSYVVAKGLCTPVKCIALA